MVLETGEELREVSKGIDFIVDEEDAVAREYLTEERSLK